MDKLYFNGRIITMDPAQPEADSLAVFGDRLLFVGRYEDLNTRRTDQTEVIDLKGRTVIPGLIETHNHLSYFATTLLMTDCSPIANSGLAAVKTRLKEVADQTETGHWIVGWGYDDTMAEGGHLTRQELDSVSTEHPIAIQHASGHLTYANSLSLEMAGIVKGTPHPAGGWFDLDDDGQPTGVLREHSAQLMVLGLLPTPDAKFFMEYIPKAVEVYNQRGVTSVHDGAVGIAGQGVATCQAYRALEEAGRLNVRVYMTTMYDWYHHLLSAGLGQGFGSDMLRVGAVKMFQDGSIQGLTAALLDDYYCQPGFKGEFIKTQAEMDEMVARYHKQGLQIAVHANGDRAIESVLTSFERAQAAYPQPELRHMIIHCQMANDDQIARMKALAIIPSYFPNHVHYWGDRHASRFIGPERAARINPLGSSVRAGLRFTLHADTPVTPIDPFHSMYCAVNRLTSSGELLGPEERITPYQALKAFTLDAAYSSFEDHIKGSLEAGKLADFLILDENPLTVAPQRIKDILVLETVVGGRTVWKA